MCLPQSLKTRDRRKDKFWNTKQICAIARKKKPVIVYPFLVPRKLLLLINQKVCCQWIFSVNAGDVSKSALNEFFFLTKKKEESTKISLLVDPFLLKCQSCSWVMYINCLHYYRLGWVLYFINWNSNKSNYAAVID